MLLPKQGLSFQSGTLHFFGRRVASAVLTPPFRSPCGNCYLVRHPNMKLCVHRCCSREQTKQKLFDHFITIYFTQVSLPHTQYCASCYHILNCCEVASNFARFVLSQSCHENEKGNYNVEGREKLVTFKRGGQGFCYF